MLGECLSKATNIRRNIQWIYMCTEFTFLAICFYLLRNILGHFQIGMKLQMNHNRQSSIYLRGVQKSCTLYPTCNATCIQLLMSLERLKRRISNNTDWAKQSLSHFRLINQFQMLTFIHPVIPFSSARWENWPSIISKCLQIGWNTKWLFWEEITTYLDLLKTYPILLVLNEMARLHRKRGCSHDC